MKYSEKQKAVILLDDGTHFFGKAAGKIGTTAGEIAFNTGMTGYQEIFTDPSYFGQILLMTPSHIGNYGTHDEEVESDSLKIAGLGFQKFFREPVRLLLFKSISKIKVLSVFQMWIQGRL